MDKMEQAIGRMAEEIKDKSHLVPFEEYLTEICTTEAVASKILAGDKTLQGAYDKMRKVAEGRKTGQCAYIPPWEGFQIINDYYGITDADCGPGGARRKILSFIEKLMGDPDTGEREHVGSIDVLDFI